MVISFDELRNVKDKLPNGSMQRIADKLDLNVDAVRNYFGATHYEEGNATGIHLEPGPSGGMVRIEDTRIWDLAVLILKEYEESLAE